MTTFEIYPINNGWILKISWLTGHQTTYYKTWKDVLKVLMEYEPE